TDPANPDTNGNGIPDGADKNPLYRQHTLTDEEGIYQAAVEALCQLGRTASLNPEGRGSLEAVPFPLGSDAAPLLLPAPPGSPGIEVLGHPGVVLRARKESWGYDIWMGPQPGSCRFTPPSIGPDGVWQGWEGRNRRRHSPARD